MRGQTSSDKRVAETVDMKTEHASRQTAPKDSTNLTKAGLKSCLLWKEFQLSKDVAKISLSRKEMCDSEDRDAPTDAAHVAF